jgi:hypothetical protein
MLDLLAITTRRERAWVNDLPLDDAVQLAAAVFEVNADFFVGRVVPGIQRSAEKLAPLLRRPWDVAVARLIRAGHRLPDVMAYTLRQAQAFLDADGLLERQGLAQWLGVVAVAAQGEKRSIEQLQRDLLKD